MYMSKNCFVCHVHFEDSQFMNWKKERLVWNAVPTLMPELPNPPKKVTNSRPKAGTRNPKPEGPPPKKKFKKQPMTGMILFSNVENLNFNFYSISTMHFLLLL